MNETFYLIFTTMDIREKSRRNQRPIVGRLWLFKCSKTIQKIAIFLRKKKGRLLQKTLFFSVKIFFFYQIKLFIENKYLCPLSKHLILLKISPCKKNHSVKQTHSVKDEFYFQFSFATNEQV